MIDGKYAAIKGIIYTNCDFLVCVKDLITQTCWGSLNIIA